MKKFFSLDSIGNYLVSYFCFRLMMTLFGVLVGGICGLFVLIILHVLLERFGSSVIWPVVNIILAGVVIMLSL